MALFSSIAQVQSRKNAVHPIQRRAVTASELISKTRLQEPVFGLQSSLERELCHAHPPRSVQTCLLDIYSQGRLRHSPVQDHRLEALTESMCDVMGLDGHQFPQDLLFMSQKKHVRRCLGMLRRVVGWNRIQSLSLQFHAQVQSMSFHHRIQQLLVGKKRRNVYLESTTFLLSLPEHSI